MRAVLIDTPGPDAVPRVGERPDPVPGAGESLVRVTAAALGHLDVSVGTGDFGGTPPTPYVPCGDGAGVVVASGTLADGTPVWIRGGGLGVARDGLAADLAAVPDAALHPFPAAPGVRIDPELAAAFFSPATSADVAVRDLGGVAPGARVLVSGAAGSVGALAVQVAAAAGARVVASVGRPERVADVPAAADVVVVGVPPASQGPFDLLVDTVGGPDLPARLALVAPGGRAVLVGYTAGTALALHLPTFMRADVDLLPLNMQRRAPAAFERADALLTRLAAGELSLPVTTYPLADAARAWADLRANRASGRVVLVP